MATKRTVKFSLAIGMASILAAYLLLWAYDLWTGEHRYYIGFMSALFAFVGFAVIIFGVFGPVFGTVVMKGVSSIDPSLRNTFEEKMKDVGIHSLFIIKDSKK